MKIHKIKFLFILALLIMVLVSLTQSKFKLQKTYKSPNDKYFLEVYKELEFKPFLSLSSEEDFAEAYVQLKDNKGNILFKAHWYASCSFNIGDLEIAWEEKRDRVYFTKFNYIDLEKYALECY